MKRRAWTSRDIRTLKRLAGKKNARGQHRPKLKADGKCDPAEGFQPRSFVGNARRTALTAKQTGPGPFALALKVAKRGRAQANTQNISAFFGAVNVIRKHAELDKIGQITVFRAKVTAHDVSDAHEQKELRVSHSLHRV
jgi:hypothetical protein